MGHGLFPAIVFVIVVRVIRPGWKRTSLRKILRRGTGLL
jgi:hypothetical protein